METIRMSIAGLGFVLYSPFAMKDVRPGSSFLDEHFWEPEDVAALVNACTVTGFCTGSPGDYQLRIHHGSPEERFVANAAYKLRLGLEVRDRSLHVRDLYDLDKWDPQCPDGQRLDIPDGFYRITVASTPTDDPHDEQTIDLWFERWTERPKIRHAGVPMLCEDDPAEC
jgi:hypothetical protein